MKGMGSMAYDFRFDDFILIKLASMRLFKVCYHSSLFSQEQIKLPNVSKADLFSQEIAQQDAFGAQAILKDHFIARFQAQYHWEQTQCFCLKSCSTVLVGPRCLNKKSSLCCLQLVRYPLQTVSIEGLIKNFINQNTDLYFDCWLCLSSVQTSTKTVQFEWFQYHILSQIFQINLYRELIHLNHLDHFLRWHSSHVNLLIVKALCPLNLEVS